MYKRLEPFQHSRFDVGLCFLSGLQRALGARSAKKILLGKDPGCYFTVMNLRSALWMKSFVSVIAVALLLFHWLPTHLDVDLTAWILIGLVALPWVVSSLPRLLQFIHSAEFGVLKLEFQDQVRDIEARQAKITSNQLEQRQELDRLQMIVNLLVTEPEMKHLQRFLSPDRWLFDKSAYTNRFFDQELRRLRDLRLITGQPGKGIRTLFDEGGDIRDHFKITEAGLRFIAFRNQVNEPPPENAQ